MRKWWPETQDGWAQPSVGRYIRSAGGAARVLPGGTYHHLSVAQNPNSEPAPAPILTLSGPLDDTWLDVTFKSWTTGPVLVSLDVDLSLYYWQENQAPFDWSQAWEIEVVPSDAITSVANWIVDRIDASNYHAYLLGSTTMRILKRLTEVKLRLKFRCGTSTPKGQWLMAAVRCEMVAGRAKLDRPPIEDERVGAVEEVSAGEADGYVLV